MLLAIHANLFWKDGKNLTATTGWQILSHIFAKNFHPLQTFELTMQHITVLVPCGSCQYCLHESNHKDKMKTQYSAIEVEPQRWKCAVLGTAPDNLAEWNNAPDNVAASKPVVKKSTNAPHAAGKKEEASSIKQDNKKKGSFESKSN